MRKLVIWVSGAVLMFLASDAHAQQWIPMPFEGKLVVSINGGGQVGGSDIEKRTTFPLYEEEAEINTFQDLGGGGLFDIGAAYRVGKQWGVGFAFNKTGDRGDANVDGSLPNPLYFNRPRTFATTVAGLKHDENAWHFQAAWFMPYTDKIDFLFTGGPTIFNIQQEFAGDVNYTDVGADFESVVINSVDVVRLKDTTVGFNLGADMTYSIHQNIGAGLLLRYTYGSAEFDGESNVRAGGFQIAVGARIRF